MVFELILKRHNGVKREWAANKSMHEINSEVKSTIILGICLDRQVNHNEYLR